MAENKYLLTLKVTREELQMIHDALEIVQPDDPDTVEEVLVPARQEIHRLIARVERHEELYRQFQRPN